ncbi:MAG: nitrogenase [Butyrivibrio sp.]|nr:nitrogenase [Butyrivibrio sp.]
METKPNTVINIEEAAVVIREKRLGTINAYSGSAEELVEKSHNRTLKDSKRKFSQCLGCNSGQAFCQLSMIEDVAIVNHAPIGCAGDFSGFNFTYRIEQSNRNLPEKIGRYFSTNITENDTVFGAIKKLEDTILEAYERVHPKAIFITTSCASGIIGEDIEGAANKMTKKLGIPVATCTCDGFRSKVWTTGFDAAYHTILRNIVKPPKKKSNYVNVVNFWGSHVFDEILAKFGYETRYLMPFSTIKQLEECSEAAATIHICPSLSTYMGAGLNQLYGVPEIAAPPAYGIDGTDKWLRALGKVLGKPEIAEKLIEEGHREVVPKLDALKEKFKGKKAYVMAGAAHGQALIQLLSELGFDVMGASVFHHDPVYDGGHSEMDVLQQAVNNYGDVKNYQVCNKQSFELVNALYRIRPDLILARHGGMTLWGAKLGIPTLLIGDEQFGIGYKGALNYARRIDETLDSIEFIQNYSQHASKPYTEWWLSQEPGYFQSGGSGKCSCGGSIQQYGT